MNKERLPTEPSASWESEMQLILQGNHNPSTPDRHQAGSEQEHTQVSQRSSKLSANHWHAINRMLVGSKYDCLPHLYGENSNLIPLHRFLKFSKRIRKPKATHQAQKRMRNKNTNGAASVTCSRKPCQTSATSAAKGARSHF